MALNETAFQRKPQCIQANGRDQIQDHWLVIHKDLNEKLFKYVVVDVHLE